ncbi:GDSL-type esterase/lipase family protein [Exiguobacterium aestuarii]|uniref:GDSL-type esterase/lipase family protein n=1 Tax=Exiguobacterium aestuarii TaxID=273527 RepID=A0ABW2PIF6_9BACL|nr:MULTISPECIES: GDSL-type esterase/lipase family protein [Exiguobacterium]MCT4787453.1 GDSL-type esterase/lipase family protein [Exiguobacterium aestuarii]
MSKSKKMFIGSISLNLLLLAFLMIGFYKVGGIAIAKAQISELFGKEIVTSEEKIFKQRQSLFESLDIEEGSVVFLGDSLIQYNEWSEMFPEENVYNRGISGDTTYGVLSRIDSIIDAKPQKIVLEIGINDLVSGVDTTQTVNNYSKILTKIKDSNANIDVLALGVLPINSSLFVGNISNNDIQALNIEIEKVVSKKGYNFIDSFASFENNGELSRELSEDGIHLTGEGYSVWKENLEPYLN